MKRLPTTAELEKIALEVSLSGRVSYDKAFQVLWELRRRRFLARLVAFRKALGVDYDDL